MKHRKKRRLPLYLLVVLGILVLLGAVWALAGTLRPADAASSRPMDSAASQPAQAESAAPSAKPAATKPPAAALGEWRAVWLSYLEYQQMDFSTEKAFTTQIAAMFDRVSAAGCNTVLAQVRPCGDAMYQSDLFPWSHFITGTQGQAPGYDPLTIMIEQAHARGLRLEAWINPYRVRIGASKPETLAQTNPAALWLAASDLPRVHEVNGGLWYDPGVPEVRELVANGVEELCREYDIDGIHFDDYFYPVQDASFDEAVWAAYGAGKPLQDWRRENVNTLVAKVAEVIKASGKSITFGISPQGNNDNNYAQQYSDVGAWMKAGWIDYVCPQIYWGFDYRTQSGSDRFAFDVCLAEWLALPKKEGVKLYVGLGAYRIGEGDGSSAESAEWQSGENLARQVSALRAAGANGYGVYRYDSLWNENALCEAELAALTRANG